MHYYRSHSFLGCYEDETKSFSVAQTRRFTAIQGTIQLLGMGSCKPASIVIRKLGENIPKADYLIIREVDIGCLQQKREVNDFTILSDNWGRSFSEGGVSNITIGGVEL